MKANVNGLEIGWDGITEEEFEEQRRIALLPEMPLGKRRDIRRVDPYGRLIPLHPVVPDKNYASHNTRWLCRCTCAKQSLRVVLAQNLVKHLSPTEGCGCVHSIRASQNLAAMKQDRGFQVRQALAAGASIRRYHRENSESVSEQSRRIYLKINQDPEFIARRQERVRQKRLARNLDPDVQISTHYARIRHAIVSLTSHIMKVRDNFTCALCGRRGGTAFAVHHAIPVEANWACVGDPSNLVTLCFRCHFKRAHAGRWHTTDPVVQAELLILAREREDACKTPPELVQMVRERLDILGRELGRIPVDGLPDVDAIGGEIHDTQRLDQGPETSGTWGQKAGMA